MYPFGPVHIIPCMSYNMLQVYLLKACQVPQSKLHLKLLQATKVIIALVKEKKQLTARLKEVTANLDRRKTPPISLTNKLSSSRVQQCDKCIQTMRDSPRTSGHVQWTSLESSLDPGSRSGQPGSNTAMSSLRSRPKVAPLSPRNAAHEHQIHHRQQQQFSPSNNHSVHKELHPPAAGHALPQQDEQQLDVSLASLKFTDSSLGESSLHQVLQMVERELSLSDNDRDVPTATVRHSTSEPLSLAPRDHEPVTDDQHQQSTLQEFCEDNGRSLELVGNKVVPHVHVHIQSKKNQPPQRMAQTARSRTQKRTSAKPRVRNYNIRD